jgi:hypothetical protein
MLLFKLELPPNINRMRDLPLAIRRKVAMALGAGMELAAERSITHYLSHRSDTTLGVGVRPSRPGVSGSSQGGQLRASIRSGLIPHLGPMRIAAYLRSEGIWYAHTQHEGWNKRIIPTKKKALFFWWEKIQQWVHAKSTSGYVARPFLKPAIIDEMENIREMVQIAVFDGFNDWKLNKLDSSMGFGEY